MVQLTTASIRRYREDEVEVLMRNGELGKLFGDSRIDPNYVFLDSGNSLLHLAVKRSSPALTKTLIRLGCNVDTQNRLGNTALMDAVVQKRLLQVNVLLKAKSDIHVTNVEGDSALKLSLKLLDDPVKIAIMKSLFARLRSTTTDSEAIFKMLTEAKCSLICAVFFNDVQVIKLMLQQGCDINDSYCYNGWTALHVAVMENNNEMIKLLVQHGCDVNIPDAFGNLPLDYVLSYIVVQRPKIIRALMPTTVCWTDLCCLGGSMKLRSIVTSGSKETLQIFLQSHQIDFLTKDKKGMTPLHYLAYNSNDGIFDLFQNFAFDVNAYDETFRKTALHIATAQGCVDGVKFLLARGANVNAFDYCGCTPLFYAISRRNARDNDYKECVELLSQHYADLQVVTADEETIFKRASYCQNYFLIQPLLAHLAIKEIAGEPIKTLIFEHIESDSKLKKHYKSCKQDLMKMKRKTVFGTVTLWKFLIDSEYKVALYTRRRESFDAIVNTNFVSNLYYISLLQKRFNKAMEMDELRTKATLVINEVISQLDCNYIIVKRIIEFLSYTDLLKFS